MVNDLEAHLRFALKREGVDLSVLAPLFQCIDPSALEEIVVNVPTGKYSRRIWFLYEWLTGKVLDVPDAPKVRAVRVVDPEQQVAPEQGRISRRHRLVDNLPGSPACCPLVPMDSEAAGTHPSGLARESS